MRKLLWLLPLICLAQAADTANQLHFALHADPKTLDPLMVTEEAGVTLSYLTQGTLLRIHRKTQKAEPALATSWKIAPDGKQATFQLRHGVKFSDGAAFDSRDVVYTMDRLLDPRQKVPVGDQLRTAVKALKAESKGADEVTIYFEAPVADLAGVFDGVPMLSSRSPKAVLGPFQVTEYIAGSSLLLSRNPNYWKRDAQGRPLPYLDSIKIDIQQNRDLELARFRRGDLDLIAKVDADSFERLTQENARQAIDAGPGLDAETIWVNQNPLAPLPEYKKAWFASTHFRRALSEAISREAMVKLVYRGAAREAFGPISPAAKEWYHPKLRPGRQNLSAAAALLEKDGFRKEGAQLRDRAGNPVEFSVITNSGNKARASMAALMEQDLAQLGIKLNIVSLDMGSIVERILKSYNYEAILLSISGVTLDPADQANLWVSKSSTHQWNPNQQTPATAWEAEIDGLMQTLSSTSDAARRKKAADRLQEIVAEQRPLIYLVHPDALVAVSPRVLGALPVVLEPRVLWNVEQLQVTREVSHR